MTKIRTKKKSWLPGVSFLFAVIVLIAPLNLRADDVPATQPTAARSVHLFYDAPPAVGFYAEVTVEKTVPGSYFEVCGFNGGYFGIQELGSGKKVGIFSVWDVAKGDNPDNVDLKKRAQTLFTGEGVRVHRFGGEGTGGHSDFDFDWKTGQTCKLYLTSKISEKNTAYAAYIFQPDRNKWLHIATFQTPDGGKNLGGLYSFIEDFRRDTRSATELRRARYSNQWIKTVDGQWKPLIKAKFTASGAKFEARDTINAGVVGKAFFLQTGGDTHQETKLRASIERENGDAKPPEVPEDGV